MRIILAEKTFVLSLPTKEGKDCKVGCRLLKNEEVFINKVMELDGCREITGPDITGSYAITFENTILRDSEIISQIDSIATEIGFT